MKVQALDGLTNDKPINEWLHSLTSSSLAVAKQDFTWLIYFEGGSVLTVQGLWRLRGPNGLLCTSEDDGQIFGLPAPVKADEKANALLQDVTVSNISIDGMTSDLQFALTGEKTFEVPTNSSGYESWQLRRGGDLIVGSNGGLVTFLVGQQR